MTYLIFDSLRNESKQLDVIISDANTPIFLGDLTTRFLPVECVYAVIEMKTKLDKTELKKVFQNMKSVRTLEKKAYVEDTPLVNLLGKYWHFWPVNYFVFSIDSIDLHSLKETMMKKYMEEKLPPYHRIDSTCVLSKGVICNEYPPDKEIDALPTNNSDVLVVQTTKTLLLFYTLITRHSFKLECHLFVSTRQVILF